MINTNFSSIGTSAPAQSPIEAKLQKKLNQTCQLFKNGESPGKIGFQSIYENFFRKQPADALDIALKSLKENYSKDGSYTAQGFITNDILIRIAIITYRWSTPGNYNYNAKFIGLADKIIAISTDKATKAEFSKWKES